MAFWNAPLDDPAHAMHAVSAALDMLDSRQALNDRRKRKRVDHAGIDGLVGSGAPSKKR